MSEKWTKAAVMRNLPTHTTKDLAIQLKDVKITNDVRHIVNIYMHDYQTGMPRGQTGPMFCVACNETQDDNANIHTKTQERDKEQEPDANTSKDNEFNAATKGKGKGKKGPKGYGACWQRGEWGHPCRECPRLHEFAKGKGSLDALKGGKGKGKKGKGGKGKGNSGWGKGYGQQYRSPGKGVGKGFNQVDLDWYNAWGSEYSNDYDYYKDDYNNWVRGHDVGKGRDGGKRD